MNPNFKVGLAGHFTMTVHGGKRGRVVLADFDNMILDAGLEFVASSGLGASDEYCQVGTGTTAAAAGQTALVSKIAHTNTISRNWAAASSTYVAGPPAYKWDYKTYRFGTGVAAGNITEVGIGWASTGNLFSRALIVDGGGSPTPITVLADETLDVTYTLRVYAPSDATGSISLDSVSYNYTLRAANMGAAGGTGSWSPADLLTYGFANHTSASTFVFDGAISATPSGTPSGASVFSPCTCVVSAYVGSSYQRAVEYKWDLSSGNISGGIKSILAYVTGAVVGTATHAYQLEFDTTVPKNSTKTLKLNFTFSLARAP